MSPLNSSLVCPAHYLMRSNASRCFQLITANIKCLIAITLQTYCFLCLFIYFEREKEREYKQGRKRGREREKEREREREWESQAGFTLSEKSLCGAQSHEPWPEPKSRVKRLTDWATQGPQTYCCWSPYHLSKQCCYLSNCSSPKSMFHLSSLYHHQFKS